MVYYDGVRTRAYEEHGRGATTGVGRVSADGEGMPTARGRATLLCGSAMDGRVSDACTSALQSGTRVLWVSYTRPPADCFEQLPDVPANRKAAVDVGGGTRAAASGGRTGGGENVSVADPNDLTGIGIAVSDQLSEGAHVCFDSVTTMLQYVERERAYTFLNSLLGHLWNAKATAHFHFNPDAHDPQTVASVTSLFDARVDVDGTVRTRR